MCLSIIFGIIAAILAIVAIMIALIMLGYVIIILYYCLVCCHEICTDDGDVSTVSFSGLLEYTEFAEGCCMRFSEHFACGCILGVLVNMDWCWCIRVTLMMHKV